MVIRHPVINLDSRDQEKVAEKLGAWFDANTDAIMEK
jgi:hypothetical protein